MLKSNYIKLMKRSHVKGTTTMNLESGNFVISLPTRVLLLSPYCFKAVYDDDDLEKKMFNNKFGLIMWSLFNLGFSLSKRQDEVVPTWTMPFHVESFWSSPSLHLLLSFIIIIFFYHFAFILKIQYKYGWIRA